MENRYRNWAVEDLWYSDKKHEEEMARMEALNTIANTPAKSSTLIYILPVAAIFIIGVVLVVAMKKKKA
jgi:hypothetical protein